jgi:diadenosine tetraphosphate (Ap4A) HIT family hydrolase
MSPDRSIDTPHATLLKFGYPANLLHEGRHWAVLVRPAQPTLGSLVLCSTSDERSYGKLGANAFSEQQQLIARIERTLESFCRYEKINYLMLMMVDPHVHFHVVPRYSGERQLDGTIYADSGWPGLPDLGRTIGASERLIEALRQAWEGAATVSGD